MNSDITLRTQLTEFRDHKLIRTKKVRSYDCNRGPSVELNLVDNCDDKSGALGND